MADLHWADYHLDGLGRTTYEQMCQQGTILNNPLPRTHSVNVCSRCNRWPSADNPVTRYRGLPSRWATKSERIEDIPLVTGPRTLCWACELDDIHAL